MGTDNRAVDFHETMNFRSQILFFDWMQRIVARPDDAHLAAFDFAAFAWRHQPDVIPRQPFAYLPRYFSGRIMRHEKRVAATCYATMHLSNFPKSDEPIAVIVD